MKTRTGLLLMVSAVLLSGCTAALSGANLGTGIYQSSPLDGWLETQLVPHLAEKLGKHPRFKGQHFLLLGI